MIRNVYTGAADGVAIKISPSVASAFNISLPSHSRISSTTEKIVFLVKLSDCRFLQAAVTSILSHNEVLEFLSTYRPTKTTKRKSSFADIFLYTSVTPKISHVISNPLVTRKKPDPACWRNGYIYYTSNGFSRSPNARLRRRLSAKAQPSLLSSPDYRWWLGSIPETSAKTGGS